MPNKKVKAKPKERVIYDNFNTQFEEEQAREWLKENGNENPTDEEIYDEIYFQMETLWEEFEAEAEKVFKGKFIAVGICGLWNGDFEGGFIFENFNELMKRFKDCEYLKVWDENGHLYMKGTHHDGTHRIEIKKLTPNGERYLDNWNFKLFDIFDKRTMREVHKKMFNDSHYTHLVNYAHEIYGCPRREVIKN